MTKNTGKSAEQAFEAYWEDKGKAAFLHRVTDQAEVNGRSKVRAVVKKQPSDYILTYGGSTFYAEVKSSNNATSFPFGDITQGQWTAALKQTKAGGDYVFFIKNMITGCWYKVIAERFLLHEGRSMKWSDMDHLRWRDMEQFELAME